MKTGFIVIAVCLATASAPLAAAQLYQWKDAQGRTIYSDQPPPPGSRDIQQKSFKGSVIEGGDSYATQVAREKHPVTLYTSACGILCSEARDLLIKRGVPFSSKDLASEANRVELHKLTGKFNVPVLFIGSEKIEGYDPNVWHAALDRAGYPKSVPPGSRPVPPPEPVPAISPVPADAPADPPVPAPAP